MKVDYTFYYTYATWVAKTGLRLQIADPRKLPQFLQDATDVLREIGFLGQQLPEFKLRNAPAILAWALANPDPLKLVRERILHVRRTWDAG